MSINLSATTPAAPSGKTNVTWQADGVGNISGYVPTATSIELQTNGTDNGSQTKLNLKNGTNVTVSNSGADVTIDGPSSLPPSGSAGGDLSGTYPNPSVAQVNGAVVPASQPFVGTNSSRQIVAATAGALPNGTTATTQTVGDDSTKVATTAYVDVLTRNPQSGAYAVLDSDRTKLIEFTGSSSAAWTIAQAGTAGHFADGWFTTIRNRGTGTVTLTPATSTIEGATKVLIPPGSNCSIYTDGSNYFFKTPTPVNLSTLGCMWGNGLLQPIQSAANNTPSGGVDKTAVIDMQIVQPFLIGHVSIHVATGAANGWVNLGIYDSLGNLIVDSGALDATTSAQDRSSNLGGILYLFLPGLYRMAQAQHASPSVTLISYTAGANSNLNGKHEMYTGANNPSNTGTSSQSLPPTTGALTAATTAPSVIAGIWEF